MIKKLAISFAVGASIAALGSCNSSTTDYVEETYSAAAVRTFHLSKNDSILANLDSVFFSIDLIKGQIYNATPMPYGTKVTALTPVITSLNGFSVAELTVKRAGKSDTTYNYITNSSDTIDFTNPVKLRVVSPDGLCERTYTITVNVYKENTDSLSWDQLDRRTLPSSFSYPTEQRTVRQNNTLHCLTAFQGAYCLATLQSSLDAITGADPDMGEWSKKSVTFPAAPRLETFTATDDALYIICSDGMLYRSADEGSTWASTGRAWSAIYGGYGTTLTGAAKDNAGNWTLQTYPGTKTTPLPQGMPVSGTSPAVTYAFAMSDTPQMLIVGGRKTDGSLSADTWGFDGSSWAKISKRGLPEGLENIAVAPYFTVRTAADWTTRSIPTLVAIGGRKADGMNNGTVYISNDYGITWSKAGPSLQLPTYIPAFRGAQSFTISSTMSGSIYRPAVKVPSETWKVPYIYLFGGVNDSGQTSNNVWRGVINLLSLKPVE